ncbi:MAG: protein YgfX [Burkholderiales bacterium]
MRFELRPSRGMGAALVLAHGASAAGLVIALPAPTGLPAAVLLLALGGAAIWSRAWLKAAGSVRALELAEGGTATFELRDGRRASGRIARGRHVGRFWVSLPFPGGARRHVLVARDMLEPGAYRRLRLWALWGRLPRCAQGGVGD